MPIIRLPVSSNPLPSLPGPVLDREKRPVVDNREVQQAVGDLAKAGKMPELPADRLAAPYRALGAVGEAVMQAGNVMTAAAIQERKSETIVQVSTAQNALRDARTEFEGLAASIAPSDHAAEFEKFSGPVISKILANSKLTPEAKQQIQSQADLWKKSSLTSIQSAARITLNKQARDAILGDVNSAIETQDEARFGAAIEEGVRGGYLFPHQAEERRLRYREIGEQRQKQAKADADRLEFETAASEAISDPIGWKTRNSTPWKGKEILWHKTRDVADAAERDGIASFTREITDAIATGDITWPSEIEAWKSQFKTPALEEEAKRWLENRNALAERKDREENGVRNAVELRQRVAAYDPEQDPDRTQYFEMRREIATRVDSSMANEIVQDLDRKYGVEPPKLEVRPEIQRNVTKSLEVMFDPEGGVTPWRKKVPVLQANGKPAKDEYGNPKVRWEEDLKAKQRAINAQTVIEMKMADWFKANPEDAKNPIKVQQKLNEVLPEGMLSAVLQNLQKKLTTQAAAGSVAGRITSYGYSNDEIPDSNSATGIGAFVPIAEQEKIKRGEPSEYRLREGDVAVSPDVEKALRAAGVSPMGEVMVQLANGEVRRVRWADRTAQDSDILSGRIKGVTKPLRGRFDFYSPRGKDKYDGMQVLKWWVPGQEVASR